LDPVAPTFVGIHAEEMLASKERRDERVPVTEPLVITTFCWVPMLKTWPRVTAAVFAITEESETHQLEEEADAIMRKWTERTQVAAPKTVAEEAPVTGPFVVTRIPVNASTEMAREIVAVGSETTRTAVWASEEAPAGVRKRRAVAEVHKVETVGVAASRVAQE
jgi:hypothetical protein